jgi:hypothetical protein
MRTFQPGEKATERVNDDDTKTTEFIKRRNKRRQEYAKEMSVKAPNGFQVDWPGVKRTRTRIIELETRIPELKAKLAELEEKAAAIVADQIKALEIKAAELAAAEDEKKTSGGEGDGTIIK